MEGKRDKKVLNGGKQIERMIRSHIDSNIENANKTISNIKINYIQPLELNMQADLRLHDKQTRSIATRF